MQATRDCTQLALLPPYSNVEGKKRHGFSKNLSTKLPKPAPLKKRHLFFAFLLRWSAVADSGMVPAALPSTPVPQHRAGIFQHQIQKYCEYPSTLLPQHRRPKNDINFQNSQKNHKLVGFRGEGIKRAPASIQKQALFLLIHFFTSSAGAVARSRPPWACRWTAVCSERTAWPLSAVGAHRRRAPKPSPFCFVQTWPHLSSRPAQRRRSPPRDCGWSSSVRPIPSDRRPSAAL